MLKKITLLGLAALAFSCAKEKDSFALNASFNDALNGRAVKLFRADGKNTIILDSTTIANGKASFKGAVSTPDLYFLGIDQLRANIPVIIENEDMSVSVDTDSIFNTRIEGSKENDVFNAYQEYMKGLQKRNQALTAQFQMANQKKDSVLAEQIRTQYLKMVDETQAHDLDFMKTNNAALVSALLLERQLANEKLPYEQKKSIYDNFTDELKNTRVGKNIGDALKAVEATAVGNTVENFSALSPEGKTVSLNDVKGKVTIIDFWASWCGPCRRENPNLVNLYNTYHDKGLEILGVSLDGNPRQKDAKADWIAAIEKDGLTWNHISNLTYFNDPIVEQFNIRSIPETFILDADGKIVAKGLRGAELEAKIAELLN